MKVNVAINRYHSMVVVDGMLALSMPVGNHRRFVGI
jgi:hypothetical protein